MAAPAVLLGAGQLGLLSSRGRATIVPSCTPSLLFFLRVRLPRGCWANPLRHSFPAPLSFHWSRTKCGPSLHQWHPGGAAHHWGHRSCGTPCFLWGQTATSACRRFVGSSQASE